MPFMSPRGTAVHRRIPAPPVRPPVLTVADALRHGTSLLGWRRRNRVNFERSLQDMLAFQRGQIPWVGQLWMRHVHLGGRVTDLGLVSCRVVTTTGAAFIVDAFQNLVELETMRYHGYGTSTAAEAVGNTALGAELTTAYSPANTRPTGSAGEQSGQSTVFETSATVTVSAAAAVTEHGIFSTAAAGTGVLLDRSVFAVVNLAAGESLQTQYRFTVPAGG